MVTNIDIHVISIHRLINEFIFSLKSILPIKAARGRLPPLVLPSVNLHRPIASVNLHRPFAHAHAHVRPPAHAHVRPPGSGWEIAAGLRREELRRITGREMDGLPLDGFDYASILGQCCELPMGFVQLLVGVAGPLLLDREPFREVGNAFLLSGGSEGIVADGADPAGPLLLDREPFREVGNAFLLSGGSEGIVADGADPAAPASSFIK
jgi:hypothetical protein